MSARSHLPRSTIPDDVCELARDAAAQTAYRSRSYMEHVDIIAEAIMAGRAGRAPAARGVDRPILFSGPMVKAIIAGRKSQTRRLLKPPRDGSGWYRHPVTREVVNSMGGPNPAPRFSPGDRLWVRESWSVGPVYDKTAPCDINPGKKPNWCGIYYPATKTPIGCRIRPGIHMPRWASRLTLTLTDVRIERLQEISDDDALAEGVVFETAGPPFYYVPGIWPHSITGTEIREGAAACYGKLWNHINGAGGGAANPWVVALTFSVRNSNIDEGTDG